METSVSIQCPFCGQSFEVLIDTSMGRQRLVTDCEVCCRPLELRVETEAGEVTSVDVTAA